MENYVHLEIESMGAREKKLADIHESDVARWWPLARTTISSGNKFEKLDVQTERDGSVWQFLIECKETQQKSYSITRELWEYIVHRTYERSSSMRPCLAIRFNSPNVVEEPVEHTVLVKNIKVLVDLAVVDLHDQIELIEELQSLRTEIKSLKLQLKEPNGTTG